MFRSAVVGRSRAALVGAEQCRSGVRKMLCEAEPHRMTKMRAGRSLAVVADVLNALLKTSWMGLVEVWVGVWPPDWTGC